MRQHKLDFQWITNSFEISLDASELRPQFIVTRNIKLANLGSAMQRHEKLSLPDFWIKIFLHKQTDQLSEGRTHRSVIYSKQN